MGFLKTVLIIICLFCFCNTYSQKITLTGFVKDSIQNPMPYANVIAKPKDISKSLQFAITDNEGYYKLILSKGDTITISYLGYKPINEVVTFFQFMRKESFYFPFWTNCL